MIEYIVLLIVAIILGLAVYASRYKKVPPNAAMVVYGRKTKEGIGYSVISGGGRFILPIFESYEFLPLDVRTLDVNVINVARMFFTRSRAINCIIRSREALLNVSTRPRFPGSWASV